MLYFFIIYYLHRIVILTDLSLDKMDATFANDNFKCIFLNENDRTSRSIFTETCSQESNLQ